MVMAGLDPAIFLALQMRGSGTRMTSSQASRHGRARPTVVRL